MSTTGEALQDRAASLREILARPSEQEVAAAELGRIEAELAQQRETAAKAEAEKRVLGIKRGYGGMLTAYDADAERLRQAVVTLRETITTLNDRAGQLALLRAEADALADRFGLPKLTLPVPPEPDSKGADLNVSLPAFWHHRVRHPKTALCEHGLRERRTYMEVADTQAYEIITAAGLRDFPPLTERQREILADKALAQQQAKNFGQAAREVAAEIAASPLGMPWQAVKVHRG